MDAVVASISSGWAYGVKLTRTVCHPGSPEAEGKAELIDAVVASITKWQGYTGGMSRVVSRVAGSLRKHRSAIHEARCFCLMHA